VAISGVEKREQLFDLYSKHFSLRDTESREIFVCPLCQTGFLRKDCEGENPLLSIAHLIPEKLGGRLSDCTLACTACNNGVGTNLEAALVKRFKADDFGTGIGELDARLSGSFGEIRITYDLSPAKNSMTFYAQPRRSNPKHVASLQQYLAHSSNGPPSEVQFHVTTAYRHRPHLVKAALYHSAYLVMFAYFGYWFVCHPHFAPLRDRIANPEQENWRSPMFIDDRIARSIPMQQQQRAAVVFLRNPSAILVVLHLQHRDRAKRLVGIERVVAVMIPGLDSPDLPTGKQNGFDGSIVPYSPRKLLHKTSYLHSAWRYITRSGQ
jgi:hypothetical protein